jgi:type II secretory pathway pseudopilin PulG
LIEILVALFISSIVLAAIYISMASAYRSTTGVERKIAAQQDVRVALDMMAMETSMASYNPNFIAGGIWKNPPNGSSNPCVAASSHQTWKGIQEATPTSITVQMDIGESNDIGDNPNEIIRYSFDAGNESVFRNPNCGGDVSFLGDITGAPAGTRTVRVINNALGIKNGNNVPAIFRYFDSKDPATELYPDINPSDIPNIRRIDITLGVETEDVAPNTGQRKRMIYSTSVLVRNHAPN